MKRLLMVLLAGFALTACSTTETTTPDDLTPGTTEMDKSDQTNEMQDASTSYVEEMGFTEIKNVNGTNPYDTYMLTEAEAVSPMVYNQWMYSWVDPVQYVDQEVMVYQYSGMKEDNTYDIYTLVSGNEVVGGYYFEEGTDTADMKNAMMLHADKQPSTEEDFMTNWNNLFNIKDENNTPDNTEMK